MATRYDLGEASPSPFVEDDLADRIEGQILRRAGGQIRDLHVLRRGDLFVLCGRSRTYHAKQLAQEAALDLPGVYPALANEIEID